MLRSKRGTMYPDVEFHVIRAADEFRAAAAAETPQAAKAHQELAEHYVRLIQCHGSAVAARIIKARLDAGHRAGS
jgi:hypothetical protein